MVECSAPEHLAPVALHQFIADEGSGLTKSLESGNYSIKVAFRPTDLWIHQEAGGLALDSATFRSLAKKYSSYYYFILSLSKDQHEALSPAEAGMAQYSALLETLSFRMDQHVGLVTASRDTIPAGDFMLDRTYGASSATNILFSFSKEKCKGQAWIEFTLGEFGLGLGEQRFRFRTKDLESAPRLKFGIVSG
jgi:hypothetical protein